MTNYQVISESRNKSQILNKNFGNFKNFKTAVMIIVQIIRIEA